MESKNEYNIEPQNNSTAGTGEPGMASGYEASQNQDEMSAATGYPVYEADLSKNVNPLPEANGNGAAMPAGKGKPRHRRRRGLKVVSVICIMLLVFASGALVMRYVGTTSRDEGKQTTDKKEEAALPVKQVETAFKGSNAVTKIVEDVMPSIVTISTEALVSNPFDSSYVQKAAGNGTGFIASEQDDVLFVVTNFHVVKDVHTIKLTLFDNSTVMATVRGSDPEGDLALLAINKSDLSKETAAVVKPAKIGKSSALKIGDDVIAIGNALGYGQSVTKGIVSALDRGQNLTELEVPLIQTDAAINPGNSGGPLVNSAGEVVGINTVKLASKNIEGMGYAIPSDVFVPELNALAKGQTSDNGTYLGIRGQDVTEQIAAMYNLPRGIYITEVMPDSPAAEAGLQKGDVITSIDGRNIQSVKPLRRIILNHQPGDKITGTIYKANGEQKDVTLTLARKESGNE
ncbi:MAG: trypsin-like peptidase domain-containing protein [Eubacteriales bacterium]|nr:trypsin-like peptidase domain-containing protein [Eubacteriales bacterium]